jgi:hypothetical protein
MASLVLSVVYATDQRRIVTAQVLEGADWVRQIESLDGCGIARAVKA